METCPVPGCGKEFKTTKALGSHLYYKHKSYKGNEIQVPIVLIVDAMWTKDGLVIECPTPTARDFVIKSIEQDGVFVRLKQK